MMVEERAIYGIAGSESLIDKESVMKGQREHPLLQQTDKRNVEKQEELHGE